MKADIGLCFVKSCFKKGFFIDPSKESYCVEDLKNSILNKISKYYLLQLSKLDRCKLAKGNNSSNTISRKNCWYIYDCLNSFRQYWIIANWYLTINCGKTEIITKRIIFSVKHVQSMLCNVFISIRFGPSFLAAPNLKVLEKVYQHICLIW